LLGLDIDSPERISLQLFSHLISWKNSNLNKGGLSLMPEVGEMAPDFELPSNLEKDKTVKLSDFRGKQNVVLAFYPLAWTPV
jgi:hypothetical protein